MESAIYLLLVTAILCLKSLEYMDTARGILDSVDYLGAGGGGGGGKRYSGTPLKLLGVWGGLPPLSSIYTSEICEDCSTQTTSLSAYS